MQDEMSITVIAAGFDGLDDYDVPEEEPAEEPAKSAQSSPVQSSPVPPPPVSKENVMQYNNPLIDGLGMGGNSTKSNGGDDVDIGEILKMLGS